MHDVREILQLAKEDAPAARYSVEDIVAAGRRRRRRALGQRLGGAGVLAVAVATVTMLTAANLALSGGRAPNMVVLPAITPPAPTAPAASPPFTFVFGGYQVDDYRILPPDEVNLVNQTAGVVRDGTATDPGTRYAGTLTVYQPGMFNPEPLRTGTQLTVQGRDAFQADIVRHSASSWSGDQFLFASPGGGSQTITTSTFAWQYAPDAWAVLAGEPFAVPIPLADQVKIAERFAVASGAPLVARVPFHTGYLPAGFTLQEVSGQSLTAENRGMVTFVYSTPRSPTGAPAARNLAYDSTITSVVISILWVDDPPPDAVKRTSRCNPGQHWCATTLPGGEFYVVVEDPSKTLSDDELLRVSDGLTFADIKDPSTWHPAA